MRKTNRIYIAPAAMEQSQDAVRQNQNADQWKPLVSVIMPAYNCAHTVGKTIESVICQTYQNWELVIVNDASTDQTRQVIAQYILKDSRIRLFTRKKNAGAAAARNAAIARARGRFLAFLDADDLWKPQKLKRQLSFMMTAGYSFTFTSYETFKNENDQKRKVFSAPKSVNYRQYLRNTIIGNLTVMMDREQIGTVHVRSGALEDVQTWMYYLKAGHVAYGLNENLASYRIAKDSRSGNKIKNAVRYYRCLRDVQKLSWIQCCICECCYFINASKKRLLGETVTYQKEELFQ